MTMQVRLNLYIVTAVFLLWGVALFMGPEEVQPLLSNGPYDPAVTGMFGASLFAFALLFLMTALNPSVALINVSIIALGFFSVVAIFQMFISSGMPRNPATFFSLLIVLSIGLILFFSTRQSTVASSAAPRTASQARVRTRRKARAGGRPTPAKHARPAGKAVARKKGAKKAARKTKKKIKKKTKKKTTVRRKRR